MKICRWCWMIVPQDDDFCSGTAAEPHSDFRIFFSNPTEMIQALTNKNAVKAIKLQKLLKKEIDDTKYRIEHFVPEWEVSTYTIQILNSRLETLKYLVKESKK